MFTQSLLQSLNPVCALHCTQRKWDPQSSCRLCWVTPAHPAPIPAFPALWGVFGGVMAAKLHNWTYFWPPKMGTEYSVPSLLLLPEWSTFCVSSHTHLAALSLGPEVILAGISGSCCFGVLQLKTLKIILSVHSTELRACMSSKAQHKEVPGLLGDAEQVEIPCGSWQPQSEHS